MCLDQMEHLPVINVKDEETCRKEIKEFKKCRTGIQLTRAVLISG